MCVAATDGTGCPCIVLHDTRSSYLRCWSWPPILLPLSRRGVVSLTAGTQHVFSDIHNTRSVTERSILPYCMMMVDGANWVVYSCLIGNVFPIGVTNAFGCLAGTTYSVVYLRTCWHDKREGVRRLAWIIFVAALSVVV